MAYVSQSSAATGELISAADWNTGITNDNYLYDRLAEGEIWLVSGKAATTNGAAGGTYESTSDKVNFNMMDFDPGTIEYASWQLMLPRDYDGGTVTYQVYYTHPASASTDNKCVWGLSGSAFAEAETLDLAFSPVVQSIGTPANNTAYVLHISAESAAVTIAGTPAANELCVFRLSRVATDGNDTLSVDARFLGLKIKYGRA